MIVRKQLPAFQFYPADWRKDPGIQSLDFFERGLWIEILCLMHESPRRGVLLKPSGQLIDNATLARMMGLSYTRLTRALDAIEAAGVSSREEGTNALVNRRMVRDEYIRQVRAASGSLGGNPKLVKREGSPLLKQTDKQTAEQKQTPSSSSSSSKKNTVNYTSEFLNFWEISTKRGPKFDAFREWQKISPDETLQKTLIMKMREAMSSPDWTQCEPRFLPHVRKWLHSRGWEIEYQQTQKRVMPDKPVPVC